MAQFLYCPGVNDNAHHTFFICSRWEQRCIELEAELGPLSLETIVDAMLRWKSSWDWVSHYIEAIVQVKKADLDHTLKKKKYVRMKL